MVVKAVHGLLIWIKVLNVPLTTTVAISFPHLQVHSCGVLLCCVVLLCCQLGLVIVWSGFCVQFVFDVYVVL
jgi:hypothetical protein